MGAETKEERMIRDGWSARSENLVQSDWVRMNLVGKDALDLFEREVREERRRDGRECIRLHIVCKWKSFISVGEEEGEGSGVLREEEEEKK